MGSGICKKKNTIQFDCDENNEVKNIHISGCFYHKPLEIKFKKARWYHYRDLNDHRTVQNMRKEQRNTSSTTTQTYTNQGEEC